MRRKVSLALALVLAPLPCAGAGARARARQVERPALRVSGEVLSASVVSTDKSHVRVRLKARLRFFNASSRRLIILDRKPWFAREALSFSAEDAVAGRYVYTNAHLPPLYRAPGNEWERLTRDLDRKTPPAGLTRTLPPGGSWAWETDYGWTMSRRGEGYNRDNKGWDELRQAPQLWLTFSFQMWPSNVEPRPAGGAEFGSKLRRRWRAFGDLWLDDVDSEPMRFEVKDVPAKSLARGAAASAAHGGPGI